MTVAWEEESTTESIGLMLKTELDVLEDQDMRLDIKEKLLGIGVRIYGWSNHH